MIDLNDFAHSNGTLEIVRRDSLSCVRKTFTSDLMRAARNVRKQRTFKPLQAGNTRIAAAEVLGYEEFSSHAELTMPYVEGITGRMFAVHTSRMMALALSTTLSTLIYSELSHSSKVACPTKILLDKVSQIEATTNDKRLKVLVRQASGRVAELPRTLVFPMGNCHGDLTLSNVILNPVDGITVIDFLDTFLETPLQDVAKLKQDFVYGWSFRACAPTLRGKAEILCRHHMPEAVNQVELMYCSQVRVLTLLALLRIAPYVKDDITLQWLTVSLSNCLEIDLA